MTTDQTAKVREMLEDFDTAMLITHGTNGEPHARPMAIAAVEADCGLWFFTGRGSTKVSEITNDQHVLIVCQDERSRYICLSGTAEVTTDRARARDLWSETYKTWFPGGVDDPDLMLIRVHVQWAEYWDQQGAKGIRYVFEAAKAYARGTRPEIKEGEQHGKVRL